MSDFPYPYDVKNLPPFPPLGTRRFPNDVWPLPAFLGGLGSVFLLMNLSNLPVALYANEPFSAAGFWTCICIGGIGGQAALLAMFAVLGPGKVLVRHVLVMPAAAALMVFWLWGAYIGSAMSGAQYQPPPEEIAPLLLVVPALLLACEVPLWSYWVLFRWRIERLKDDGTSPAPRLSIGGILLATAAVALSLTGVRTCRLLLDKNVPDEAEFWAGIGVAAVTVFVISLLFLPMAVRCVLGFRSAIFGILVSIAWIFLLPTAVVSGIQIYLGLRMEGLVPFETMLITFCAAVVGPLLAARLAGYRLHRGRNVLSIAASTIEQQKSGPDTKIASGPQETSDL